MRGYFGIALYRPKNALNVGSMLRNAQAFGANFAALIAPRYPEKALINHPTNVAKSDRHLPVFTFATLEEFLANRPFGCPIVRVEVDGRDDLPAYRHPEQAIYLFGPEDGSLPILKGERSVRIDTAICLNLAMTTGVVMYDRLAKATAHKEQFDDMGVAA